MLESIKNFIVKNQKPLVIIASIIGVQAGIALANHVIKKDDEVNVEEQVDKLFNEAIPKPEFDIHLEGPTAEQLSKELEAKHKEANS